MSAARGKLEITIAVKCDEELVRRLDALMRKLEQERGEPMKRSMLVRALLEERLGLRRPRQEASDPRARE